MLRGQHCPNCSSHVIWKNNKCEDCGTDLPASILPRRVLDVSQFGSTGIVDQDTYRREGARTTRMEVIALTQFLKANPGERSKLRNYNAARLGIDMLAHYVKLVVSVIVLLVCIWLFLGEENDRFDSVRDISNLVSLCSGESFITFGLLVSIPFFVAVGMLMMTLGRKVVALTANDFEVLLFVLIDYVRWFILSVTVIMFFVSFSSQSTCPWLLDGFSNLSEIFIFYPVSLVYSGMTTLIIKAVSNSQWFTARYLTLASFSTTIYAFGYLIKSILKRNKGSTLAVYFIVFNFFMALFSIVTPEMFVIALFASKTFERGYNVFILTAKDRSEQDRREKLAPLLLDDRKRLMALEGREESY